MEKLNIFISWSKPLAKQIADVLFSSLENIFSDKNDELDIFLSSRPKNGIEAGKNFHIALNNKLSESDFGILILTEYNQNSDWLMFEAGALSKHLNSYVIPFLFNRDIKRREDPIQSLQYFIFKKEDFIELSKIIQRILLKTNHPNLNDKEQDSLMYSREKEAEKEWHSFEGKIKQIIKNYIESPDDLSTMDLIMDESAYEYVVSKREDHLKKLIEELDSDNTIKRIIIFGGMASYFMKESTMNAFARWLAKDHKPKLYFCQETLDALLSRAKELNEKIVQNDEDRAKKATEKIKKIKDMNEAILRKVGEDYKKNIFFINLKVMPSNFITISDNTIYLTPALDKRSSDTFTFKLSEKSKLNFQLLDYMLNIVKSKEEGGKALRDEIEIIKSELGEKNEK